MRGLIQWWDHEPRVGECYVLAQLHPIDFVHVMPATEKHAGATVKIHVAFGLHTFTRAIETSDPPEDHYGDNLETRCFCHVRYAHSHRLPTIVREIPTCRTLYYSRTKSGLVNYATFDAGGGVTYAVFFDVARTRVPSTALLTVKSAYELAPNKRDIREGRVGFNVMLGHALRGTKPHPPTRAR